MDLLNFLVSKMLSFLATVLPFSPFRQFLSSMSLQGVKLGWLNWIVPVGPMLKVMAAWLASITVFYAWSILARWVKVIGD